MQRNVRQCEIKMHLLPILYVNLFTALDHEYPYTHLTKFSKIFGTLRAQEDEKEVIFIILFPHSLIGKEKEWYLDQLTLTVITWILLEEKFLNIFFPYNKFMEAKKTIMFSQGATKTLGEIWERYKSIVRQCTNNDFYKLA